MGDFGSRREQKSPQGNVRRDLGKSSSPSVVGPQGNAMAVVQRAAMDPYSLTPADVMQLQRMMGNQAVGRLLAGMESIQAQTETEADEEPVEVGKAPVQRQDEDEEKLAPVQMKPNNTGMPDHLKAGVENLSGISMGDVRVHYNSDKPMGFGALAYTQGTDIHRKVI